LAICFRAAGNPKRNGGRVEAIMMKKLSLILAISLLMCAPCRSQEKASTPNNNAKGEGTIQEKDQYQREIEAKLRELDQEIDGLKTQAANQSDQARKQFDKQMAELDRKREIARRKLNKFENSSEAAWRDMKPGINSAMKDLEAAYQRAAAHFK
jgi:peptidoglycan hydrolase CwlO-like protein